MLLYLIFTAQLQYEASLNVEITQMNVQISFT